MEILLAAPLEEELSLQALHVGDALLLKSCYWTGHI